MTRVIDTIVADFRAVMVPQKPVEKFLVWSWVLIVALMPFHALLSTWGGSTIGPLEVWKSWKELLLFTCLVTSVGYLWRQRRLRSFCAEPLVWLIGAYGALHLLLWAIYRPETSPALAGILMNLRFLGIFLLSGVLLTFTSRAALLRVGLVTLFAGAMTVLVIGLLQMTVLPKDFLSHFGYGPSTIAPYTTLDSNESIIRIQSTLRGPNPLGQYLIMIGLLFAVLWPKARMLAAGGLLACAALLAATHSRSAWIGAVTAAMTWVWLTINNAKLRQKINLFAAIGGAIAIGLVWWLLPQSTALQNVLLHNKKGDSDIGSTAVHAQAGADSLQRIVEHPFGRGPGTAGPASFYGTWPQVPENYYLQVAEEVGLLGLLLFVAIIVVTGRRLYRQRPDTWAVAWLAVFVGFGVVNVFLHGWADDTAAILWWAIAGVLLFPLTKRVEKHKSN